MLEINILWLLSNNRLDYETLAWVPLIEDDWAPDHVLT